MFSIFTTIGNPDNMSIFKTVKGMGENFVLIHGSSVNHEDMFPIINELSSQYKITSPDLPGMGHSDWNQKIQNIHDIADTLLPELPESAIYLGWSFGGLICQSIGARYPKRMRRFIGVGTTPRFIADSDWMGFPKPGYAAISAAIFEKKDFKTFLKDFYEHEFNHADKTDTSLYPKIQEICAHRPDSDIEIMKKVMAICDSTDLRKELASMTCPIDFIFGAQDVNIPKASWGKIKALNQNIHIHEIKDAEHAPFWTHPKEFFQILNEILGTTPYID